MSEVAVRSVPYPFRGMLAICSDLDETPDRQLYIETLRFLNTTGTTRFGEGLGLEVGNTIYFDMPATQFSYWNTDDHGRSAVRALIGSGHVDCLHSFGDHATTRSHAGRALDELARHDCRLAVWIDHGVAPSNFGADIMRGEGDVPGSPAYHADLTCAFGIKYVWRGRVTSVVGQGVPRRLGGIFEPSHPLASAVTLAKEAAKGVLARAGHSKYRMHLSNHLLEPAQLRDGHPVCEFLRANPHFGGVSAGETASGIGEVLGETMLDRLTARGGISIIYTHLGKVRDLTRPFDDRGVTGLRRLANAHRAGRVLVTTTRRLLGYAHAIATLMWTAHEVDDRVHIDLHTDDQLPATDLDGLTFYVHGAVRARLFINGHECGSLRRNAPDHTGRPSVSLPWRPLEFPSL